MYLIFWIALAFLTGSIPFSFWLGKIFLHVDIRNYGDGNPGSTNAMRAGKKRIGIPALLLDYLKGFIPVFLAKFKFGISGWELIPVALAPVAGHAFSPFLGFKGGKAVAATFGIWTGLTLWAGPTVFGVCLQIAYSSQTSDAWSVMFGMMGVLVYLLLSRAELPILAIWFGNLAILAWKHRHTLKQPIKLKQLKKINREFRE